MLHIITRGLINNASEAVMYMHVSTQSVEVISLI